MRGDGRIFRRGNHWWVAYYVHGREFRESAGRTEREARQLLRARRKEIYSDQFVGPQAERVTIRAFLENLLTNLDLRGVKSLVAIRSHLRPVEEAFADLRAVELTADRVERYVADRLAAGKAPATVNRELQLLKQAFTLARRQGRVTQVPLVPSLREDNAREGFFEADEFERVVRHLPEPVDDIARFAYFTGWRKGEILLLRWQSVDRRAREVRLRTSKSGHGRMLPLDGALWELIARRWAARRYVATDGVTALSEYVFHRRGRPLVDFKRAWASACAKAETPTKLFHDLRRTAVRNMIRAGVPQSVAMAISGHRTVSMFLRYNITSDEDLRQALRRTQAHLDSS